MPPVARTGAAVFADPAFMDGFAAKFRPLVMSQEVKLLNAARGDRIPEWSALAARLCMGSPERVKLPPGSGGAGRNGVVGE